ncbi:MAG: methyltransferase domain-containing protein [Kiloniellales bacterium]
MSSGPQAVSDHYTRGDLGEAILAALRRAGKDPDNLAPGDLSGLDQFHFRGLEATRDQTELVALEPGSHVLDVGCGIGGPARYLAGEFGCRVIGLDLTEEFCRVGAMLAERTGLADRVEFRQGDALDMPFEDAGFDLVWTQHASMNIADKARLHGEMYRVLKSGGRLALYDIVAGNGGPLHFPVPWARRPEISFLTTPEELRAGLAAAGFRIDVFRDVSEAGLEWRKKTMEKIARDGQPPLGLHVVMGSAWREMFGNVGRNLEEDRIRLIQLVARKG